MITDNNEFETWIEINKLNESAYSLFKIALKESPATQWAMYISITISILMAIFLIIGIVYGINVIY